MKPNWFIGMPFAADRPLVAAPEGLRVFEPVDLHVTAAFLGGVSASHAEACWAAVRGFAFTSFAASLGEVRLLGANAVSLVLEEGFESAAEVMREVCARLEGEDLLRPDPRPPLPHVTVARTRRRASPEEQAQAIDWAEAAFAKARAQIDALALYTWSSTRPKPQFVVRAQRQMGDGGLPDTASDS